MINKAPEPAYITEVFIKRIVDGDTYEVELKKTFNVRLADNVDTDELSTARGKETKKTLEEFVRKETNNFQKPVILRVPLKDPFKLMDFNSFERVVGEIWINDVNLSDFIKEKHLNKKDE